MGRINSEEHAVEWLNLSVKEKGQQAYHYAVSYDKLLHSAWQLQKINIGGTLNLQKVSHISSGKTVYCDYLKENGPSCNGITLNFYE